MGYGTITTEKSCGKRPSRSAYSLVRIGITRRIEQLGMVLRGLITGLLGGRDPGEAAMATAQAEQALDEALQLQPGTIATLPATDLLQHLQHRPDCTEANLDLLADLLIALADAPGQDIGQAAHYRQQALALMEHLNATGNTFNMERHGKMARLRVAT